MKLTIERIVYWFVWSSGVLYSLYSFCSSVNARVSRLEKTDFASGWQVLGERKQDVSDVEWVVFVSAFSKYWYLMLVQVLFSQILLARRKQYRPVFYSVYSMSALLLIIGPWATAVFVLYILFVFCLHLTGYKCLCYIFAVMSLYIFHQSYFQEIRTYFVPNNVEGFLIDVGLIWLVARCLSFAVDRITFKDNSHFRLKDLCFVLSYCLYLPTIFTGPLMVYQLFVEQLVSSTHLPWGRNKVWRAVKAFSHVFFGYVTLNFMLHFVYSSSVQFYPEIVARFDSWSLCGLGYALPMMFYLKYFVIYSLSSAFAGAEDFDLPPPPKCISRINLPSQLWRTFDRGLYEWILKYLYLPFIEGKWKFLRKTFALAISFGFVCVWHGMDKAVCTWTLLNFFNLSFEVGMFHLLPGQISGKSGKIISPCIRRLNAWFSLPHFVIMCLSCVFFLANFDVGHLVFKKIVLNMQVLPVLGFIMYCGCHVAIDVKELEEERNHKYNV